MICCNFNSIKVRLEQPYKKQAKEPQKFQFHKGTIRTNREKPCTDWHTQFQFHKGTIRTSYLAAQRDKLTKFQFHKGTIRTPLNLRHKCPYIKWVCECKDTKILQKKCRCLMIFFLRSYDNLPIYGGLNKSKSTFVGFAWSKSCN